MRSLSVEKFYGSLDQFDEKDLRMIFYNLMNAERYCKEGRVEEKS